MFYLFYIGTFIVFFKYLTIQLISNNYNFQYFRIYSILLNLVLSQIILQFTLFFFIVIKILKL